MFRPLQQTDIRAAFDLQSTLAVALNIFLFGWSFYQKEVYALRVYFSAVTHAMCRNSGCCALLSDPYPTR